MWLCSIWRVLEGGRPGEAEAEEQWLRPWDGAPVSLTLRFPAPVHLSGIAFWNYNASLEMSYYGVIRGRRWHWV